MVKKQSRKDNIPKGFKRVSTQMTFWNPAEHGEILQGLIVGKRIYDDRPVIIIDDGSGQGVWGVGYTQILNALENTPVNGTIAIYIEYKGEIQTRSGRTMFDFEIGVADSAQEDLPF